MQASFGQDLALLYGQQLSLSVADPRDACTGLKNVDAIKNTVVLMQRGSCLLSDKVTSAVPT